MARQEASETSPLLKPDAVVGTYLESGESVVGPLPSGSGIESQAHVQIPAEGIADGHADRQPNLEARLSGSPGQDPAQREGLPEVRSQLKYIVPAVALGIFLSAADQTLVASSAGRIGSDLNALKSTSWVATAYFLTLTSFQPLYGKLSDIFGRKACILSAYLIFSLGCLWCGTATTIGSLIAARAFAGIGGGGMTTCVSILLSDIIPLRERGTWQGFVNIIYATGSAVGAPLGGFLSDTIGWKWAFLAQFPICLLAFISVFFALQLPQNDKSDWREKLRRVDFAGAITLVVAVTVLLIGLDQGSNVSWQSPVTITCLIVSLPLFGTFAWIEHRVAAEPFAPGRIIFERSHFAVFMSYLASFAGWFGILFYVPLYFQAVDDLSATQAGVRLLPAVFAGVSGSLIGGVIMQKTGKYYWLAIVSWVMLVLGGIIVLLFAGTVVHSTLGISIGLAVGGLGNGSGITAALIALISNASFEDQAVVTANSYLFRALGSVLGLSFQSALFQNLLRVNLRKELGSSREAEQLADRIRESLDYVRNLDPHTREVVRNVYAQSTTGVFGLVVFLTMFALISSFFVREKKLESRS